jgi:hypothetical protein
MTSDYSKDTGNGRFKSHLLYFHDFLKYVEVCISKAPVASTWVKFHSSWIISGSPAVQTRKFAAPKRGSFSNRLLVEPRSIKNRLSSWIMQFIELGSNLGST